MKCRSLLYLLPALIIVVLLPVVPVHAATIEYDLTIAHQEINITGKSAKGMTINGGIPGPTLYFKEGDTARIHVHNKMKVDTSIHWHGLLVPPGMDGVPYVSFPPIAPGTTFTYEFPIRQSGTYWYHSHTNLQEQSGIYGSIVIMPRQKRFSPEQDYVVLFSDWSDEDSHAILRTLKRGSEWYALQKGSAQSIIGAARVGMLGSHFQRELQRMPPMDIADVAYDRFLVNGKPEIHFKARSGDTIRLRVVDGSATTYFHLNYAGGPMTIIAADGQNVEPVKVDPLLVSVAETYDVLITVPSEGTYEFRATAHDGSGAASVWIGSGKKHYAPTIPKPNLYHSMGSLGLKSLFALTPAGSMNMSDRHVDAGMFDKPGMMDMGHMQMEHMNMEDMNKNMMHNKSMDMNHKMMQPDTHSKDMGDMHPNQKEKHTMRPMDMHKPAMDHSMPMNDMEPQAQTMPQQIPQVANYDGKRFGTNFWPLGSDVSSSKYLAMDGMDPLRPWPPYDKLRATFNTSLSKDKPVREIRLTLDGDMDRYVWFLNNKPLSESDTIRIKMGEVVRFIMINRTMMHHPMHLHGHFFRVINKQGDYAPLKHTVNVAPMSTTVIEFDANELGDWFFHCHLLYHMKSGMAQVVHYDEFIPPDDVAAVRRKLYKDPWYMWAEIDGMSHMNQGFITLSNTRNILNVSWEIGWEEVDETEWEATPTYSYYVNRFTTVFIGADLEGEKDSLEDHKGVVGFNYLLPLNIEFMTGFDTFGEFLFSAEKEFELTPRFMLFGEAEYDTETKWEGQAGAEYLVSKHFSLIGQWHSEFGPGGGLRIRF